jgi:modulator of FtsH protease
MSNKNPFAAFNAQQAVRHNVATASADSATILADKPSTLATNKLIRNTYSLLALTLMFSAFTAGMAMLFDLPRMHWLVTLIGFFGLFFLTAKLQNSVWGLVSVFALTGFMGLSLGGMLDMYLAAFANGNELIMMAFGTTAVMFFGLSGYALTTRKDFSFLGGFFVYRAVGCNCGDGCCLAVQHPWHSIRHLGDGGVVDGRLYSL